MNRKIIIVITLSIVLSVMLIFYYIFVVNGEEEKTKYYKYDILYVTNWDKYNTMLKRQKRVIFKKKLKLIFLTIIVKVRRVMNGII